VHHPKKQTPKADATFQAEQDKRRREEALSRAPGLRVLSAIDEAVPVRLMKLDLLFVVERLAASLNDKRLAIIIRQFGIGNAKEADAPANVLTALLRKTEERALLREGPSEGRLRVKL
jgi:ParB family chromosome partitioning protein